MRAAAVPAMALALATALLVPGCGPTYLGSVPPVCGRAEVLAFLNARLRRDDPYAEVLPATASERPAGPGLVACAVQVRVLAFDTPRLGRDPAVASRTLAYSVREASGGGLVVDMGR